MPYLENINKTAHNYMLFICDSLRYPKLKYFMQ